LERFFGIWIISNHVMGEVVKDFEGEKEAWRRDVGGPAEDGLVYDFYFPRVRAVRCRGIDLSVLHRSEGTANLNDFEFCAGVDFWVGGEDIV